MRHRSRASLALAGLLALAVAVPAFASPAAQTTSRRTIGLQEARQAAVSRRAVEAAQDGEEFTEYITGTVSPDGGYWEDALIFALALYEEDGEWWVAGWGFVADDGSYEIGLWDGPGTYRVDFFDEAYVYEEVFYKDAQTPETATDVIVGAGQTVTSIDQTVTPTPEVIISGRLAFEGAPPPAEGPDAVAFQYLYDQDMEEWGWWPVSFNTAKPDGSYRLHLPSTGTYRVGFWDWTGAFSEVYYKDAADVESATDISVETTGVPVEGIDQTMTVSPSKVTAGANRYATAVAVSQEAFPDEFWGTVVLTTGEDWPDALCAAPLAGVNWGPLLLTRQGSLPGETLQEIVRLEPYEVIIVGGYDAVSLKTEVDLRLMSDVPVVRRIIGRDRYETAAMIAQEMWSRVEYEETPPAVVVSGERYADAMCAAPLASWNWFPILLTRRDRLPQTTAAWLDKRDITETLVVGGEAAVSDQVADQLPDVTRVGGANRYATAVALARYANEEYGFASNMFGVASGQNFPDGLVAGSLLGMQGRSLLLTGAYQAPGETLAFLEETPVAGLQFFGGEPAMAPWVVDELLEAAGLPPLYDGFADID